MPIHSPNLVVSPRRPTWQYLLLAVLALALVLASVWISYRRGMSDAGYEQGAHADERSRLNTEIRSLKQSNAELRGLLAAAERQLQIDRTGYAELDEALQTSTRQLADLRKELGFYQNIISAPEDRRGVVVQQLDIEPAGKPGSYRFEVIVIQAYNHKNEVKGRVGLRVTGTQGGEQREIKPQRDPGEALVLRFRYFQKLRGSFDLPEGFQPQQIVVTVTPDKQAPVTRSFEWPLT
ncbi:MAG: hypothetical protein LJE84_11065 [Gammaproteobacteria bacterium]|nr:hypothetical protein [Gammaproteobacteria bacterium]